jgi:hypothetical protein
MAPLEERTAMSLPRERRYRSAHEWPATPAIDGERWTITEPDDAPPPAERGDDQPEDWGDIPPRRQVSPIELAQLAAHGCV